MDAPLQSRRWRLAGPMAGTISDDKLAFETGEVRAITTGEVLVRNRLLSIDPTTRLWLSDVDQKATPIKIGETVRSFVYGDVIVSEQPGIAPGDRVFGIGGWEDISVVSGARPVLGPDDLPFEAQASVVGMTGLTAWFGVQDLCRPVPGETMVVSAAAGAVGLIAAQLGKLAGARVVGIVGSAEKCRHLVEEIGLDACVLRTSPDLTSDLAAACPDGIDVAFENVGGAVLDAVLESINPGARVIICGMIAGYEAKGGWPRHDLRPILMKSARIEGLLISKYWKRLDEGAAGLGDLVRRGALKWEVDVLDGLERAPDALRRVMAGHNRGKMLVRL